MNVAHILLMSICATSLFGAVEFIDQVPYAIGPSGSNTTYKFAGNLSLTPGLGTAIQVDGAENVEIDFDGYELWIFDNTPDIGIQITNSSFVEVHGGKLRTLTYFPFALSQGVKFSGIAGLHVHNMQFHNLAWSISTGTTEAEQRADNFELVVEDTIFSYDDTDEPGSRGIVCGALQGCRIERCAFKNCWNPIWFINNYRNVMIKECTFHGDGYPIGLQSLDDPQEGYYFAYPSDSCTIEDCQFAATRTAAWLVGVRNTTFRRCSFSLADNAHVAVYAHSSSNQTLEGLVVEDSTFIGGAEQEAHIKCGDAPQGYDAKDVAIRGCIFSNTKAKQLFYDIVAPRLHRGVIEDCIFDSCAVARDASGCPLVEQEVYPLYAANIMLGGYSTVQDTAPYVADVVIRRCLCGGPSQCGIRSDTGTLTHKNARITIEDCDITAQECGIELSNTTASSVRDTRIKNVSGSAYAYGVGALVSGPLSYNVTASSDGIEVAGTSISSCNNGLIIEQGTANTVVRDSSLFANQFCQFVDCDTAYERNLVVAGSSGPCQTGRLTPAPLCQVESAQAYYNDELERLRTIPSLKD